MKAVLFILLIGSYIEGYSQEKTEYKIIMDFYGMSKAYNLEFSRSENKNLVIASKEKNGKWALSKNDSLALLELLKKPYSNQEKMAELSKIKKKYTDYAIDTLTIKQDNSILNLTDSFVQNWKNMKVTLDHTSDKRIIADGYSVKISLRINQGNTEVIYVRHPTSISHPKVWKLISELENFYKNNSLNPVIN